MQRHLPSELFQSTLPARGATAVSATMSRLRENFNPRSPHGERRRGLFIGMRTQDISIHAPRTGSDVIFAGTWRLRKISIHAPRTGSDGCSLPCSTHRSLISIHAPRTGSDASGSSSPMPNSLFQSTLPARGATPPARSSQRFPRDFNPRSPHGERRTSAAAGRQLNLFQSTLPARGATRSSQPSPFPLHHFNPRSPHGERQNAPHQRRPSAFISIHAPRTGSDGHFARACDCSRAISIHAPRTGSDTNGRYPTFAVWISIHAPRTGSDRWAAYSTAGRTYFNPRSPHGERL